MTHPARSTDHSGARPARRLHRQSARVAPRPSSRHAPPDAVAAALALQPVDTAPPAQIYDALRAAHAVQRALCSRLVRASARDPGRRAEVQRALACELAAHAAAEERFFYVPLLMRDDGLDASRHALSEHHAIDELVEDLQALALDGDAWHEAALALSHKVRHHLKEEESRFFQVSGKILGDAEKRRLGLRYQREHDRLLRRLARG